MEAGMRSFVAALLRMTATATATAFDADPSLRFGMTAFCFCRVGKKIESKRGRSLAQNERLARDDNENRSERQRQLKQQRQRLPPFQRREGWGTRNTKRQRRRRLKQIPRCASG